MLKFIRITAISFSALTIFFGCFHYTQGVTKAIGETAAISVTCSDADSNLSQCNVTSPCVETCSASGASGFCSCNFVCAAAETFNACGLAVDLRGSTGGACLDTVICQANVAPQVPGTYPVTWDYCSFQLEEDTSASIPTFHWTYSDPDGDPQVAYEIKIDDNAGFPHPDPTEFTDSGGPATSYTPSHRLEEWNNWMDWGRNYWWIVRVTDKLDDPTHWSEWSSANKFETPAHAYPWSGFLWSPLEPTQNEVTIFTPDQSGLSYLWTVTGDATFVDSTGPTSPSPHVVFTTTDNTMKLLVTDEYAHSCESEQDVEVQLPLPEYREVSPVIWFKNIFSEFASIAKSLFLN